MQSQTGFVGPLAAPQLSLFSPPAEVPAGEGSIKRIEQVKAPCLTSEKLMTVLEEITGWRSEFQETSASYRNRAQSDLENVPAQGTFSIVDMSADWPANQFTAHRGKCDQLVGLLGDLVGELQSAKLELTKVRSAIAVLQGESPATQDDDEILVDSFVPKFGRVDTGNVSFGSRSSSSSSSSSNTTTCDDEFEVLQQLGGADGKLVPPPFAGWQLGGTTGIVEDTYLDWLVDDQERIAISVGKIESAYGDGDQQAVLKVEPLTSEFRVAVRGDLRAFYHWDAAASQIGLVGPSTNWIPLGVGDAIIACTKADLDLGSVLAGLESEQAEHQKELNADAIAQVVNGQSGSTERTLVLQRGNS